MVTNRTTTVLASAPHLTLLTLLSSQPAAWLPGIPHLLLTFPTVCFRSLKITIPSSLHGCMITVIAWWKCADVRGLDLTASETLLVFFFFKEKCALDTQRIYLGAACEDTTVCTWKSVCGLCVCVQAEEPKCYNYHCFGFPTQPLDELFSGLANTYFEVFRQIQCS